MSEVLEFNGHCATETLPWLVSLFAFVTSHQVVYTLKYTLSSFLCCFLRWLLANKNVSFDLAALSIGCLIYRAHTKRLISHCAGIILKHDFNFNSGVLFLKEKIPLNALIQDVQFGCIQSIYAMHKISHVNGPRWQSRSPHTRFDP